MGRQGGWSETFSEDGTPNKEVIEKVDLELLKLKEISE
jgi:hypothetical protein